MNNGDGHCHKFMEVVTNTHLRGLRHSLRCRRTVASSITLHPSRIRFFYESRCSFLSDQSHFTTNTDVEVNNPLTKALGS